MHRYVALSVCSWAFASGNFILVPACIFAFIAAHAIGQGTVIWVKFMVPETKGVPLEEIQKRLGIN